MFIFVGGRHPALIVKHKVWELEVRAMDLYCLNKEQVSRMSSPSGQLYSHGCRSVTPVSSVGLGPSAGDGTGDRSR